MALWDFQSKKQGDKKGRAGVDKIWKMGGVSNIGGLHKIGG